MPENPFGGATQDPIALLEQLIRSVANLARGQEELKQELKQGIAEVRQELKQEIAGLRHELKQEIAEVRQELKQEISRVEGEVRALRAEVAEDRRNLVRLVNTISKEQDAQKQALEAAFDRKMFQSRTELRSDYAELEERIARLEEAERRRKAGEGA